ncbi:MAG: hypothetical protein ACP5U2_13020 [Bryobacteraceae bacterium]
MAASFPFLVPAARLRPPQYHYASTGLPAFDALAGGLPRGAITEVFGPPGSGRTSLLWTTLATATARGDFCALVDATDAFDPAAAAQAGVPLDRLLWVRCGGDPERALKAADRIVNDGGFNLLVLDLADLPLRIVRRIPLVCWFRLRRAIEGTPAILLVIASQPVTGASASLVVEMKGARAVWSGAPGARLLEGGVFELSLRPDKPGLRKSVHQEVAFFAARVSWAR